MRKNTRIKTIATTTFDSVTGQLNYKFAHQPLLDGARIIRLAVDVAGVTTLSGKVVATVIASGFITLMGKGEKLLDAVPLRLFYISNTNPSWDLLPILDLQDIDWQKSYIEFPNGTTIPANQAFSLNWEYEKAA